LNFEANGKGEAIYILDKNKIKENSLFTYYLLIKASYEGNNAISIIPIFNKENFNGIYPNLNYFVFMENFPIKKGDDAKVMACVNFPKGADNSKIKFVLKDQSGSVVAESESEIGNQTKLSEPISFNFKAEKDYDSLEMEAVVMDGNEMVDKYASNYSAKDFGLAGEKASSGGETTSKNNYQTIGFTVAIVILLIALILIIVKKRKKKDDSNDYIKPIQPMGPMIFLAIFFLAGLIIAPSSAKAANYDFVLNQSSIGVGVDSNYAGAFQCGNDKPAIRFDGTSVNYNMRASGDFVRSGGVFEF